MRAITLVTVTAALLALPSCDLATALNGNGGSSTVTMDDLELSLTLSRDHVRAGGTFTAEATVRNTGTSTARLQGAGYPAFIRVERGGERVAFTGTNYVCTMQLKTYEIAPGETLDTRWEVEAYDVERDAPAPAGAYRFVVNWTLKEIPNLERGFRVR